MNIKLSQYDFPEDLKWMEMDDMKVLSDVIREFLIEKVSQTGGHLASNLGVVELSIGLHRVFSSPRDKIIWDVGHQAYVHKILTGRAEDFDTLRQYGGMSGFPKACESDHDAFDTGHSSTSISAACGMVAARDIKGEKGEVIAVIGDGALTGGMAFEALNNLGASKSKAIVILNDNGMSISKNIGGLSQHLNGLRVSDKYIKAKSDIKKGLQNIGKIGNSIYEGLDSAKESLKHAIMPKGIIFEELGFTYLGPIDGHNLESVIGVLEQAKQAKGPVLVHLITKKGKGYEDAEKYPDKFHGVSPFNPETGKAKKNNGMTYSSLFGKTAVQIAKGNPNVVAITAAMGEATGLGEFSRRFPKRFFDVGIAEQHAVTFAAGLAKAGMRPIVAIYSSFLQRAYDQIIEDVCLQNLPVIFAIDRAGVVGADGATHHGVFDLSYLRSIPNLTVLTPTCGNDLVAMLKYAMTLESPVAIRYPREGCTYNEDTFEEYDGCNWRLSEGKDVDIWACGRMLDRAIEVKNMLVLKGIDAGVVAVTKIKPLDISPLEDNGENKKIPVVTLEDNNISGGFGEGLDSALGGLRPVINIGWPDDFVEHGDIESLEKKHGLDAQSIVERICEELERKARYITG